MDNYIGFIYLTTNLINKKIYIGQRKYTKNTRRDENYLGSGILLIRSIKKHGRQNFQRIILKQCINIEELNEYEKKFIKQYNSLDPLVGYNLYEGGYFTPIRNEEFKINMSNMKKQQYMDGTVAKTERKQSAYTKKIISEFMKERLKTKTNHPLFGKTHSNESKEKMRKSQLGKTHSNESKEKMRKSHLGITNNLSYVTPEWRKTQSEIQKNIKRKNTKIIYVLDKNEILLYSGSIRSTCEKYNFNRGTIREKLKKSNIIEYRDFIIKNDLI